MQLVVIQRFKIFSVVTRLNIHSAEIPFQSLSLEYISRWVRYPAFYEFAVTFALGRGLHKLKLSLIIDECSAEASCSISGSTRYLIEANRSLSILLPFYEIGY